ncbi:hypothetical protein HUT19_23040 [Streptomyces sp. NA02950]|uniref:alpha/beta fold hydrolase n=1 Tax=Streptomyces sp. NA02950 TaxID=2742137 RepID=UPI0015907C22|nr:hypothetical protein [Streptomyces sp. NA02950]QKV94277.1 hypothetical protein HUT19_23040 [Streptomyces sp. NA02950]
MLVLAGELDSGPRPRVAAGIASLFRHAELTVQPGAGHHPRLDVPVRFTRTVAAFLTRWALVGIRGAGHGESGEGRRGRGPCPRSGG